MPESTPLIAVSKQSWRWLVVHTHAAAKHRLFRNTYLISALLILIATTAYWTMLGAGLQIHNADQLSDPYLFNSWAIFHGATFPATHTFLLKWPIFLLLGVFGISPTSLLVATVAAVVLTVAVLAFTLYKIERRPLVLGTLYLALALTLLLVPTQPYAGGILPVNMAMLTTRNLEYAVYLGCLVLFLRAPRIRNRWFIIGTLLLGVLIASDKLFLSLSAGGALLALIVYAAFRQWQLVTLAVRWLAGTVSAFIVSAVLLALISVTHFTHLASGSSLSPYSVAAGAKDLLLGTAYALLGLLTNFGANPAYDNLQLKQLPRELADRLLSVSGLVHLLALAVLVYGLILVWRLAVPFLRNRSVRPPKAPMAVQLSFMLLWSTVAALGVFIVSSHYYAVDARYLTIGLFAAAVSAAAVLRKYRWQQPERLVGVGALLLAGTVVAGFVAHTTFIRQGSALNTVEGRNQLIVQALAHHKVDVLVGDYWRVLPIRLATRGSLNTLPLGGCTTPSSVLTSSEWQPDLATHSFAYLVTLDGSLTDFPNCTLPQITQVYGRPNATQIIAGTLARPKEALLFYDQGTQTPKPTLRAPHAPLPSVIAPVSLNELAGTDCTQPTIMNVVAHEDDDLLFLSPDLQQALKSGDCVRTVFLTAGDNGSDKFYWLGRQLGSEAAYDTMLGSKAGWEQQTLQLAAGEYATVMNPRGNTKVSLIFFNLPDGDLDGSGFPSSHHQSLAKLQSGSLAAIQSVDGESSYTASQLVTALGQLMNAYQPAEIRTQADVPSDRYPDHSDHMATGRFTLAAAAAYDHMHFGDALAIPVKRYIGYPIHGYASDVSGEDLRAKEAAFLAYAQYDGGVCHSMAQCDEASAYGAYLTRQYTEDPAEQ